MNFPRSLVGALVLIPSVLLADNPYQYRYGSAAYERAVSSRRSDERLGAPVTNSGSYTPDFSGTISEIRKTLGTKLTPQQIVLARRREQEEDARRRAEYDQPWSERALPSRASVQEPPAPPSYAQRMYDLANEGNSEALRVVGRFEMVNPSPEVQRRGLQRLEDSANRGNEKAAQFLMSHYSSHPELNKFPRVIELMEDLASRGDLHYVRELAEAYLNGIPGKVQADPVKALRYLNEGLNRWADGTCGLALARAYRDGKPFPRDTAKAIATYRQLIDAQSKREEIDKKQRFNTGAAGWEWLQLVKAQDPELRTVDAQVLALWEFAAQRDEYVTRAATHRLAAELGNIYASGSHGPRDPLKAILFLSIATNGDYRGVQPTDTDEVVLSSADQARQLYTIAQLLLEVSPAWPKFYFNSQYVHATPRHIAQLYTRACAYASQPDKENAARPFPSPFLQLYRLSYDKAYGLNLDDDARLALIDRGLDLGEVPNDPDNPEQAAYAELLYEHGLRVRALGDAMEDTQHRAAVSLQKSWDYGYLPAALPLAELIDDLRLPGKTREDAKAVCRLAAQHGDVFCAAQLGTWLTGEIVQDAKRNPAMIAEAQSVLIQAADGGVDRAHEDLAVLCAALGKFDDAVAHFKIAMAKVPSPRNQAGYAELLATGKGGLKADTASALKLLEAASDEDALYTVRLAEVIQRAQWGTTKNMEQVVYLLERALIRDNEWRAGLALARLYHTGVDVPKDEEKASEFIQSAGERGNNEAARAIAEAYTKGEIINRDLEAAAHWQNIAIHGLNLDPG